jgi:aquaporin Z
MGCCVAVCSNFDVNFASGFGSAIAFGLAVVTMVYTIGGVSGCHINPAITLGAWITKRITRKDAIMYMIAQVLGTIVGLALLWLAIYNTVSLNTYQEVVSVIGILIG